MTQTPAIPTWTAADRFRKAREHAGLDQGQLAEATGLARQTVSNYERGATSRPRRAVANLWAMATGVPAGWLLEGEVRPEGFEPPTFWFVVRTDLELAA
jgi:transcriptional regulator with XRE-family HTH domain